MSGAKKTSTAIPEILTDGETADILGVEKQTLACWRSRFKCHGQGPNLPHVKIGGRVRYLATDVAAFIEANRHGADL